MLSILTIRVPGLQPQDYKFEDGPRGVIVSNLDDNEKVTADWEFRNGEDCHETRPGP